MPYETLEAKLRTIPEDYFAEVAQFLDFIAYKAQHQCNRETADAFEEIQQLKNNPNKRESNNFAELLEEVKSDV